MGSGFFALRLTRLRGETYPKSPWLRCQEATAKQDKRKRSRFPNLEILIFLIILQQSLKLVVRVGKLALGRQNVSFLARDFLVDELVFFDDNFAASFFTVFLAAFFLATFLTDFLVFLVAALTVAVWVGKAAPTPAAKVAATAIFARILITLVIIFTLISR